MEGAPSSGSLAATRARGRAHKEESTRAHERHGRARRRRGELIGCGRGLVRVAVESTAVFLFLFLQQFRSLYIDLPT